MIPHHGWILVGFLFACNTLAATCPSGVRIRKDYRDLSSTEWNEFIKGVQSTYLFEECMIHWKVQDESFPLHVSINIETTPASNLSLLIL
jgi:hypothetical protein